MDSTSQAGYVAIVGRPNVGKSTLLNRLTGEKISIVSRKAQTTRHRITGILSLDTTQFVFVDTPGFQTRFNNALNRTMNRGVRAAMNEVDIVIFVIEAGHFDARDRAVMDLLSPECPVILAINKMDHYKDRSKLMQFLAKMGEEGAAASNLPNGFSAIIPICAASQKRPDRQLDDLLSATRKHLPRQDFIFPADEMTDRSERFLASEYIREKIFRLLGEELPYAAAVEIEKFEQEGDLRRIFAAIVVDRDNHKSIIIGKNGQSLKRIASEARRDMERLFGGTVYLEVWVRVKSGWQDNERLLKELGYDAE